MSTWLYLECLDHDPPLQAEDESGQHLYDLPDIREDISNRDVLVRMHETTIAADFGYFRNHTVRFLAHHKKCRIGIRDEYGRSHPVKEEEDASSGLPPK